jgi:hypothetical protein
MADFCRSFDEDLWEAGGSLRSIMILCEGHGRYEELDENGRPILTRPFP